MPWEKGWKPEEPDKAKTKVFDAFIALAPTAEVIFLWPEATLNPDEEQTLRLVLSQLNYFGRAESWCTARLSEDWTQHHDGTWVKLDKVTGEVMAEINSTPLNGSKLPKGSEPVRILCADPENWDKWNYKTRSRPDPPWNLLAETADLHAERWSDPPGSRWLTYLRPDDAFAGKSAVRGALRKTNGITVVRYALDGTVLPLVQETLSLGELARQYLQGIYGRRNDGATSMIFSGKTPDGTPLQGHRHAFYLPSDEDNDGRLDHLTVYARGQVGPDSQDWGFEEAELHALDTFRRLRQVGGKPDLQLVLLGVGTRAHWKDTSLFGRSRRWRSVTPFVPPRHHKVRGRKRETPIEQLQDELQKRGFPRPIDIQELRRCEVEGHSIRWIEFRRERLFGGGSRGQGFGHGFVIDFAEPVAGPLCFGYGCHFGLGLFVPAAS
jgi:CRISPR-associated protein Csb2